MDLGQFRQWATGQGSVTNPDGSYPGECVSLVQQYLNKVYGIGQKARGHAKDWATNSDVAQYFDRVSSPQAGDIGISGATNTNPYGHIWIYLSPTTILEQNGRVARKVSTGAAYSNPIAILRRKVSNQGVQVMDQSSGTELYRTGLHREPENASVAGQWNGKAPATAIAGMRNGAEWQAINRKVKGYDALAAQVAALSSRPTKAELEAVVAKFNAANTKVAQLEAEVAEAAGSSEEAKVGSGLKFIVQTIVDWVKQRTGK